MAGRAIDTSIVVCTCSRVQLLRRAVESLLAQTWARDHVVELVIVDDGSSDGTAEYLKDLERTAPLRVCLVQGRREGIAGARNVGFSRAQGVWLASFDDDQIASADWLRALRERADAVGATALGGALTLLLPPRVDAGQLGARVRSILGEHAPFAAARPYTGQWHPATNNALLRRDVYVRSGGFDVRFTEGGEDKELFRRLARAGSMPWFEPAATALHITPLHRLERANLRWTSLRMGASDARLHLVEGRRSALLLLIRRLFVMFARDLPCVVAARGPRRADALCSMWYTEGLLRAVITLGRSRSGNSRFLQSMNFRERNGERRDVQDAAQVSAGSLPG